MHKNCQFTLWVLNERHYDTNMIENINTKSTYNNQNVKVQCAANVCTIKSETWTNFPSIMLLFVLLLLLLLFRRDEVKCINLSLIEYSGLYGDIRVLYNLPFCFELLSACILSTHTHINTCTIWSRVNVTFIMRPLLTKLAAAMMRHLTTLPRAPCTTIISNTRLTIPPNGFVSLNQAWNHTCTTCTRAHTPLLAHFSAVGIAERRANVLYNHVVNWIFITWKATSTSVRTYTSVCVSVWI